MISANEIRIGNLVKAEDDFLRMTTVCKIKSVNEKGVVWDSTEECSIGYTQEDMLVDLDPIPLTEEWLLKFGFEKDGLDESEWFVFNKIIIHVGTDDLFYYNYDEGEIEIQSVHQLQNLYFALTGNELELK